MHAAGRRKCAHCNEFFIPDPRQRQRQRHCAQPECRRVSKAESQRRWLAKPENKDWWRGPENVQHVREWRAAHPGYWRRAKRRPESALQDMTQGQVTGEQRAMASDGPSALQETWRSQPPLLVGLIAQLTGIALQDDMAGVTGRLIARGQALLGELQVPNDREKNPLCGATASCAGSV